MDQINLSATPLDPIPEGNAAPGSSLPTKRSPAIHPALLLMAIVAMSLLPVVVWEFYVREIVINNQATQPDQEQSDSNGQTINVPETTLTPQSDWKVYTNSRANFSIKYPGNYFKFANSNPEEIGDGLSVATSTYQGKVGNILGPDELWLYVSVGEGISSTLKQFADSENLLCVEYQRSSIRLGGKAAYKIFCFTPKDVDTYNDDNTFNDIYHDFYYFRGVVIKDNKSVSVSLSSYDKALLLSNEELFDQMLSTLEFSD